ncbi:hypothetical protein GCM10010215_76210 [Streptomyces virginiae]|uniref:Uncharacterized protein n=1 Tax=Streptomyces virginiae TaxID=1961 RepID=A0ABQ3NRV5_STRVG|nr:hypothetical protein GCM10010215_76210 [Streptomyces virginiae]GHI15504.1 hypothetical protein Scinn_49670 [Streptomyces virginiae]GLV91924.1 hypothetical protein Slala04_33780 [Streptomyces lavendulae subsp. lavendulae]
MPQPEQDLAVAFQIEVDTDDVGGGVAADVGAGGGHMYLTVPGEGRFRERLGTGPVTAVPGAVRERMFGPPAVGGEGLGRRH